MAPRVLCVSLLAFIATLLFAAALSAGEAQPRLHIVTGFLPLYCWTANLAGEHATVENLLPARAEPHDYAFTPGDARKLANADQVVVNGLGLETWLPKFLRGSPNAKNKLVSISAGLESQLIASERHHGHKPRAHGEAEHANPHIWLDPQLATHAVSNILAALQRVEPAHATAYASNAQVYLAKLRTLDRDIQQSLAAATNRAIVTYHDAFPYFARRYGLEIAGVVEEVPEINPTPKYLARLGRMMRERGVRVIFVEQGSTTRVARRIAQDLRVDLVELDTLESGPLTAAAYEERMRHNAAVLQKYLK